ncbi:unnamed protein product [Hyaloperonospora brassicae]|uniref:Uncharacterized protein n=1 Tax=Hyaloperonospora brassicae TaxID=162125 RepID=A0AAV0TAT0_HYABA|nr:unnamed protein product [Hyaloperonospora brassicae]
MSATLSSIPRVIDNDSDSDDDVPLSLLRAKAEPKAEVEAAAEKVKVEAPTRGADTTKRQTAPESDSDDDVPISGLVKRHKLKAETEVKQEQVRVSTARSTAPKSTPRKGKKRVIQIKIRQQECTEELYESLKGRLAQELLCRWWYAMEWPPVKKLSSKLHGVQELDGFPGAYIRVKGDDLGSIIDTRSSVGKPSLLHFLAMSSEDLLKLLLRAYDKQMEVLIEHEGPNTPLLKDLQKARASAARINAAKADRSIRGLLKKFAELEREIEEVEALALKEENDVSDEGEGDDDGDTADD